MFMLLIGFACIAASLPLAIMGLKRTALWLIGFGLTCVLLGASIVPAHADEPGHNSCIVNADGTCHTADNRVICLNIAGCPTTAPFQTIKAINVDQCFSVQLPDGQWYTLYAPKCQDVTIRVTKDHP